MRPISTSDVLRDLDAGEPVFRSWAPEAVAELEAAGRVMVSGGPGHVRLVREHTTSPLTPLHCKLIAALPATTSELSKLLGLSTDRLRVLLHNVGAVPSSRRGYAYGKRPWVLSGGRTHRALVAARLEQGPATAVELAACAGMTYPAAGRLARRVGALWDAHARVWALPGEAK